MQSIEENTTMVNSLELNIFPNPVETEATINFNIEESTMVSYQIYDLSGRMVQNATLGNYGQGTHSVKFNVENLKTGSYIVKLQAGTVSSTSKILVY
jgi:flagellar hook assembly protein FlgD